MKVISLENVSKKFFVEQQSDRIAEGPLSSFFSPCTSAEYQALRGINMEVEKGQIVGIIGRNGAGKTTLLSILAGILTPTTGKVKINGRISSLLTLGAGFQGGLTGVENIYLNSSIIGMDRSEVNRKYRSIAEFSELGSFLNSPLQTYSQGMRLRLGFSIAIHMDFDILLIDEILSVGDVSFQKRCFDKIQALMKQGKTMIITTQCLDVIERLCTEAFLLEDGTIIQDGHPQKVAAHYLELVHERKLPETFLRKYSKLTWWADKRFWGKKEGTKEAQIVEIKTYNCRGDQTNRFKQGEKVTAKVYFVVEQEISQFHFGIAIFRGDGVYCYGPNTAFDGHRIDKLNKGDGFFSIEYKSLILTPGQYRFSTAIWDKNELWAYDYHAGLYQFEIIGDSSGIQLLNLPHRWEAEYRLKRFTAAGLKKLTRFFNLSHQWQDKTSLSEVAVSSVELFDSSDTLKDNFNTGEDLKIKLQLTFIEDLKKLQDCYLWIGLFRGDDVYCHGVLREINQKVVFLIYPKLPLLAGDYYLSAGIWEKDQKEPLFYKKRVSVFKMLFGSQDHGTVFLEHSWNWKLP